MSSNLIPLVLFCSALIAALATGCVIDCRRGNSSLILRRSESPVYYWFFVSVLATTAALWLFINSK
ncbi:hypothetical protein QH494_22685 [Sphingomonas sp. AR_OL41]|uniref:hypothetical protein n=1 Tax=Sphingomonas sp. AR_OL41 TaxID=3042729 RepID=UPI00247FDB2D|nr:hypothetical protein [Sphingomonas sp. AR_OL41]MDH7975000.1 hypothetical protein [Sphingomonas sp. AR_OL41]